MVDDCSVCGVRKVKHATLKMCHTCYQRHRYETDADYRERVRKRAKLKVRKFYNKHKADPAFRKLNNERQKMYRENDPVAFSIYQLRYHMKKVDKKVVEMLMREVYG